VPHKLEQRSGRSAALGPGEHDANFSAECFPRPPSEIPVGKNRRSARSRDVLENRAKGSSARAAALKHAHRFKDVKIRSPASVARECVAGPTLDRMGMREALGSQLGCLRMAPRCVRAARTATCACRKSGSGRPGLLPRCARGENEFSRGNLPMKSRERRTHPLHGASIPLILPRRGRKVSLPAAKIADNSVPPKHQHLMMGRACWKRPVSGSRTALASSRTKVKIT